MLSWFLDLPTDARLPALRAAGLKRCFCCKETKPVAAFSKDASRSDGLQPKCKSCYSAYKAARAKPRRPPLTGEEKATNKRLLAIAYRARKGDLLRSKSKAWMAAHKEEFARYQKEWRAANADREAQRRLKWTEGNRDRLRQRNKEYAERNKGRYAAHVRARQARKLLATPPWADMKAIEAIYVEAARLTSASGIAHHVDHIFPLKSKIMCGLHIPQNLQILTATENLRKGNRVDMVALERALQHGDEAGPDSA